MKRFWLIFLVLLTQQATSQQLNGRDAQAAMEAQRKAAAMRGSGNLPFLRNDAPPVKDPRVLASIPQGALSAAQLQSYVQKIVAGVSKKVSAQARHEAETFAADYKAKNPTGKYLPDAALALWLVGANEGAMVLMGQAAQQDPGDVDNLSDFAAVLTQHGGGQLALPILQNLNARFPGNSTILNNIGQAWFSIGDFDQASQYLKSAVKIYPMHSMANYTQAIIEEAAGDTTAAVQHIKASLKAAYSDDKADRLEKMGVKLRSDDISWNIPRTGDEMGFGKFVAMRPAFYFSRGDVNALTPQWVAFTKAVMSKMGALNLQMSALQASPVPKESTLSRPTIFAKKAAKKHYLLKQEEEERTARFLKEVDALNERFPEIRATFTVAMTAAGKIRDLPAREAAECTASRSAGDELFKLNKSLNDKSAPYLVELKQIITDRIYFAKYSTDSEKDYQLEVLGSQLEFLGLLGGISNGMTGQVTSQPFCIDCGLIMEMAMCELQPTKVIPHSMVLPDFDDIHCDIHGSFSVRGNGYFWDCNKESIKLKTDSVKIDYQENWAKQTYSKKFEVVISKSIGASHVGPLSAEASVGGGAFWESTEKGFTDAGVIGKADVTVNVGAGDLTRDIGSVGVEVRNGINSGPTVTGSGLLSGYVADM